MKNQPQYSSRVVNTNKYSAMAEFKRRIGTQTKLNHLVSTLNDVAKEYNLVTICRQGTLSPNIYTLGFLEDGAELTHAFTVQTEK